MKDQKTYWQPKKSCVCLDKGPKLSDKDYADKAFKEYENNTKRYTNKGPHKNCKFFKDKHKFKKY